MTTREQVRVQDLKKRMVAVYGSSLLPLSLNSEKLEQLRKDDSKAERERKIERNKKIIELREAAYAEKVPEMMKELDKIVERIRAARTEAGAGVLENIYSTGTAASSVFNLRCDECGNKVRKRN
jgi:uncharacterized protein (DUF342 family)